MASEPNKSESNKSESSEFKLRQEANRRYWETDDSVNGIAEDMELSKGRLYSLIEPLPVEALCPECDRVLVFANRTARDRGELSCTICGFEGQASEVDGSTEIHPHPVASAPGTGGALSSQSPAGQGAAGRGDAVVAGALLLGVAAGVVIGRWMRS